MPTPILDSAILKLRRKLGDIYDELGNEMVVSTSPASGQIYVGNSALRSTWTAAELLDIYNDSITDFISYCVKFIPKDRISQFIPGYLRYGRFTCASQSIGGVSIYKVNLDTPNPIPEYILDVKDEDWNANRSPLRIGVVVPPDKFFSAVIDISKATTGQLWYTVMTMQGESNRSVVLKNMIGSYLEMIYISRHTAITHNATIDLSGITPEGMKRIQVIAEVNAQRYRSQEIRDIPEAEMKQLMETDMAQR